MPIVLVNNQILLNPKDLFTADRIHPQRLIFADSTGSSDNSQSGGIEDDKISESKSESKEEKETTEGEESPDKQVVTSGILGIQSDLAEQIDQAIGTSREAIRATQEKKNKKLTESMRQVQSQLYKLKENIDKSAKPITRILEKLAEQNAISKGEAKDILNLDASLPDYKSQLKELTDPLREVADPPKLVDDLVSAKNFEAAKVKGIQSEYLKITENLAVALEQMGSYIYQEAYKERAIDEHSRSLGFKLEKGTKLRYKFRRPVMHKAKDDSGKEYMDHVKGKSGEYLYEPIFRKAIITGVSFKDAELLGPDGKHIKVPSLSPFITLEVEDETPDKNGNTNKETIEMHSERLSETVDDLEMTEFIEENENIEDDISVASKMIGVEIKEGATFDYRSTDIDGTKVTGKDHTVKITKISKQKDDYFDSEHSQLKDYERTMIELDKPVVTKHFPQQETKKNLTLGEFVRWYRRVNSSSSVESIEDLQEKLKVQNTARNEEYERNSNEYPPIEVTKGEILYYDTHSPKLFRIEDIKDNKIHLDNGSSYTPASFLAWADKNEVEKMTPEAEALKQTRMIEDPEEKEKEMEKTKKRTEDTMEKREEAGKKAMEEAVDEKLDKQDKEAHKPRPPGTVLENSETAAPPSTSALRKFWKETYVLSMGDFYEIGKHILEYIKRYWDRKQKGRIGAVGKSAFSFFPQLGGEFEKIEQNAETEEVDHFVNAYKEYGYSQLAARLDKTSGKDELKAIITVMSDKGYVKWRDNTLWAALLRVAVRQGMDVSKYKQEEDYIKKIIDNLWGEGSFRDFKNKNDSAYTSKLNESKEWAKRLENDPEQKGGMKAKLQRMLLEHLNGDFVDPAIYEGILFFALEAGKLTFEDKLYFFMMGFAMYGKPGTPNEGKPIQDFSRLSQCEGELLNNFPILDYFTDSGLIQTDEKGNHIWDPKTGEKKKGQITKEGIKGLIHRYIESDKGSINNITNPSQFDWGKSFTTFIENEMIVNPNVVQRLVEKSSSDMGNWDHDDYHMFASQLTESSIEQVAKQSGAKQLSSLAAMKNAFAGLNHFSRVHLNKYMSSSGEADYRVNLRRFMDTMRAFIKLEAIVDKRYHHNRIEYTRLTRELDSNAGAEANKGRTVRKVNKEMTTFMQEFITKITEEAMKHPDIPKSPYSDMTSKWTIICDDRINSGDRNKQSKQTDALNNFGENFETCLDLVRKKIGYDGISNMMHKIQHGGGQETIKGIMETSKDKKESQAAINAKDALETMKVENITSLAQKVRNLQGELQAQGEKTNEQIESERKERVSEIINLVREGRLESVGVKDEKLLKEEIDKLNKKLGRDIGEKTTASNNGIDDDDLDKGII